MMLNKRSSTEIPPELRFLCYDIENIRKLTTLLIIHIMRGDVQMSNIIKNGYNTDEITRNLGNRRIKIENLTPRNADSLELKNRISSELYEVYCKYSVSSKEF